MVPAISGLGITFKGHSYTVSFVSQVFPPDEIEQVSNKDDMKTSLRKVVKEVGNWSWRGRGPRRETLFPTTELGKSLSLRVASSCLCGG